MPKQGNLMSKKMKPILITLLLAAIASTSLFGTEKNTPPPVTRAAFDLGSGKFKLLVADVQGTHVQPKFSRVIAVELGGDFAESKDQTLSAKVERVAELALHDLKEDAKLHGAT
jgi:hypothetical protein